MNMNSLKRGLAVAHRIRESNVTIYDDLSVNPNLIFSRSEIEDVLNHETIGIDLNYPLRTRSKMAKSFVCQALGYPVPSSFKRTRPRFPGQDMDVYVQKANNLQIWNEDISTKRRYALIRVDENQRIVGVRVVTGATLAEFDTTGTLTQKHQARSMEEVTSSALVSENDTRDLISLMRTSGRYNSDALHPYAASRFLPIERLYERLIKFVGYRLPNPGVEQERLRGAMIHKLVQESLGGSGYENKGQIPDVPDQLLELKLQTSPTIDLGLERPDSVERLTRYPNVRYCDIRYAIFYDSVDINHITINHIIMVTGEDFFHFFRSFGGFKINKKIQLNLPLTFFFHTKE